MQIGVSTAIFWDYKKLDLPSAIFHSVDALGFEAVEIHCEDPFFEGWGTEKAEATKKEVKDTLSTLDVGVSLHAPYHDLNIATLNARVGEEVIRQYTDCIETARFFGSEIVNVHPGFRSSRKFKREVVFQKMLQNFAEICEIAEDYGIIICVENLASKRKAMGVKISELKSIIKGVNNENLKLTLDVAHANTTDEGPQVYARELKDYIQHMHLSDNTGDDDHLSLGQGNIDFKEVLKELHPYDEFLIVEGWIPEDEDPFLELDRTKLEKIREELAKS